MAAINWPAEVLNDIRLRCSYASGSTGDVRSVLRSRFGAIRVQYPRIHRLVFPLKGSQAFGMCESALSLLAGI